MPPKNSTLLQQLAERKALQAAEQTRRAQEAVANDIYLRRSEEMAEMMAEKMSRAYQTGLESALTGLMGEVAKGMGQLEKLLAAVEVNPQVDLSEISAAIASIKADVAAIEIPEPAAALPPLVPSAAGSREPIDYEFDVARDENGFISSVKARAIQ